MFFEHMCGGTRTASARSFGLQRSMEATRHELKEPREATAPRAVPCAVIGCRVFCAVVGRQANLPVLYRTITRCGGTGTGHHCLSTTGRFPGYFFLHPADFQGNFQKACFSRARRFLDEFPETYGKGKIWPGWSWRSTRGSSF